MKDSSELFEALSHPVRIKILKILEKKPASFASLKRQLGIESSGNLDFHLKKLGTLVTVREDGLYGLTEAGKDALQSIDEADSLTEAKRRRIKRARLIGGLLCISSGLLAIILEAAELYLKIAVTLYPGETDPFSILFSFLCGLLIIFAGVLILLRINTFGGVISIIFDLFPLPPIKGIQPYVTANHIYNLIFGFTPSSLTFITRLLIAGIVGSLPVIGAFLVLFVGRKIKE